MGEHSRTHQLIRVETAEFLLCVKTDFFRLILFLKFRKFTKNCKDWQNQKLVVILPQCYMMVTKLALKLVKLGTNMKLRKTRNLLKNLELALEMTRLAK